MFLSFSSFNIFSVHPFCYSTAGRQIRRCFGRCFVLLVLRAEGVEGGISINAANGKMLTTRKLKTVYMVLIYIYIYIYTHIYIHIYIVYIYMGYSGLYMRSVTYSSCFLWFSVFPSASGAFCPAHWTIGTFGVPPCEVRNFVKLRQLCEKTGLCDLDSVWSLRLAVLKMWSVQNNRDLKFN